MAGIYVHIPFCRKACHYCNFHFTTSFNKKDELIGAIIEEVRLQSEYLKGQKIKTIYFGGGTPSALPPSDIEKILQRIGEMHQVRLDAEITLEANPDDIKPENLQEWKQAGINRLSIGLQAFQDELLIGWNRTHSAGQARLCIPLAQAEGFENITADLIYGSPGLSDEDWEGNIQTLINFGIPHISCYALT
ncbi:MAG TPA: radical SAM protein, partial [Saprospiraceae bacterium]|nr:radical SAM protein [Saprospiraceae bacterium]